MRFTYCPHCGNKLIKKEIGDEWLIPYCSCCKIPLWDMFTTSIIAAVVNENVCPVGNDVTMYRNETDITKERIKNIQSYGSWVYNRLGKNFIGLV